MGQNLIDPNIIKEIRKQTIIIESFHVSPENNSRNSGIIIAPDAIITADHCVIGKTVVIKEKKSYPVDQVAIKLCAPQVVLLNLSKPVFPQPTIKLSHELEIGEQVFYVNLSFGEVVDTFHHGYLSATVESEDGITYYYIDGPFCPGMSGSGVYNVKGELVGMIMMTRSTEDMMMTTGLIVPVQYFEPLIYLARKDLIINPTKERKNKKD